MQFIPKMVRFTRLHWAFPWNGTTSWDQHHTVWAIQTTERYVSFIQYSKL